MLERHITSRLSGSCISDSQQKPGFKIFSRIWGQTSPTGHRYEPGLWTLLELHDFFPNTLMVSRYMQHDAKWTQHWKGENTNFTQKSKYQIWHNTDTSKYLGTISTKIRCSMTWLGFQLEVYCSQLGLHASSSCLINQLALYFPNNHIFCNIRCTSCCCICVEASKRSWKNACAKIWKKLSSTPTNIANTERRETAI